jgi:hypothetical protein
MIESNDGATARVRYQTHFDGDNYHRINDSMTILIVENGQWKIEKINSETAPTTVI